MTVRAEKKDGKKLNFECDRVLVAVGRRPFTQGLDWPRLACRSIPRRARCRWTHTSAPTSRRSRRSAT